MSDNIPFELQGEIIKRLPVRSLIQSRSVSKSWKHLIDSTDFIHYYSAQQQRLHYSGQQQHFLVRYDESDSIAKGQYFSVVDDDDTFPEKKVSLTPPLLVNMLNFHRIIGSSHGLLCVYGSYCDAPLSEKNMAVLWNLSVRKAVGVVVPNVTYGKYCTVLGFGVFGETSDPKIVKTTHLDDWTGMDTIPDSIPWQVEVFTLSTGAWRSPYGNLPSKSAQFNCSQVVVDGFLYWLAIDRVAMDGGFEEYNLIISFDMTSEEFKELSLPESLAIDRYQDDLDVSKLRNSLVVLESDEDGTVVWIMEGGIHNTFTKLYTIYNELTALEFRKSGELVVVYDSKMDYGSSLVGVYEPYSKHLNNVVINGRGSFFVYAYMETLLLLDQPNFSIYNKGKRYIQTRRGINP